jgi:hypothetical protein
VNVSIACRSHVIFYCQPLTSTSMAVWTDSSQSHMSKLLCHSCCLSRLPVNVLKSYSNSVLNH